VSEVLARPLTPDGVPRTNVPSKREVRLSIMEEEAGGAWAWEGDTLVEALEVRGDLS
jgi:hypothetical protein